MRSGTLARPAGGVKERVADGLGGLLRDPRVGGDGVGRLVELVRQVHGLGGGTGSRDGHSDQRDLAHRRQRTTLGQVGLVDVRNCWKALPDKFRADAYWVMHPTVLSQLKGSESGGPALAEFHYNGLGSLLLSRRLDPAAGPGRPARRPPGGQPDPDHRRADPAGSGSQHRAAEHDPVLDLLGEGRLRVDRSPVRGPAGQLVNTLLRSRCLARSPSRVGRGSSPGLGELDG